MAVRRQQQKQAQNNGLSRQDSRLSVRSLIESIESAAKQAKQQQQQARIFILELSKSLLNYEIHFDNLSLESEQNLSLWESTIHCFIYRRTTKNFTIFIIKV